MDETPGVPMTAGELDARELGQTVRLRAGAVIVQGVLKYISTQHGVTAMEIGLGADPITRVILNADTKVAVFYKVCNHGPEGRH